MSDTWEIPGASLTKLRSDGQHSRNYLCIPQPATVLTASLSALPTSTGGAVADLPITVVSGSIANVLPDMTCLVMNSAETALLGIVRIRKAPITGTLYISEDNYETSRRWVVGNHLVVLDEFCLWPRHLRVVDEDTFYADWDVAYSDQHAHPDPVIRLGPPVIPVWKSGATVAVPFDGSESAIPFGSDTIASWAWTAGAGSVANDTTHSPTVTLSATGRVRVKAQATSSASKVWSRYAYIEAYDANRMPITEFEITSAPEASSEGGGWSFGVRMYGEAGITTVRDRALVCLWSDDYYLNVKESLGPVANRNQIIAWGWIAGETIEWDADGGFVTFEVKGGDHWLGACASYPVGVEDTDYADNGGGAPNRWTEIEDLTVDKAVWHYCHWRTTIDRVCDVRFSGDTRGAAQIASAASNLWAQLQDLALATLLALPAFDRFGRLFIECNQQHVPIDERDDIPVVIDLTTDDHYQVEINRRIMPRYAQVAISGVYFANGYAVPMGAYAPGKTPIAPAEEGPLEETELVMGSQTDANEWAGLIAGSGEGDPESAVINIPRNYRWFDIAPHTWITLTVASADTERGITLTEARMIPRRVVYDWDAEAGCWGVTLECEGEGVQIGAVLMEFPGESEEPPEDPEPEDPPVPPENEVPEEEEPGDGDAVGVTTTEVRSTADLSAGSPTWTAEGTHPSAPVDSDLTGSTLWVLEEDTVWKTDDIGGGDAVWEEMTTAAIYNAATGNTNTKFLRIRARSVVIYVMLMTQYPDQVGTDQYWLVCLRSINNGQTWSSNGIIDFAHSLPPWYFDQDPGNITFGVNRGSGSYEFIDDYTLHITGSFDGTTGNHHVYGTFPILGDWADGYPDSVRMRIYGDLPSTMPDNATVGDAHEVQYKTITSVNGTPEGDDVYYYSGLNSGPTVQNLRITGASVYGNNSDSFDYYVKIIEVDGIEVASGPPTAFDVAPSNINYVYASVGAKIYASINHGWLWEEFYDLHGANDICVDPQLAGAIYYASTEGDINLMVRQPDGSGAINATLDTESEVETPLRIARDLNSGRLWVLNGGGTLRCRYNGSWSEQKTGLSGATGLHSWPGGKLIFVDGSDVYISDDYGATVTAKKGGWSGFASGVNGHRL